MKVIKVIGTLDFGGIEKVFEITAAYYQGEKADLVFLCLGKGGAAAKKILEMGYRVIVWESDARIPDVGVIGKLVAFFRAEKPDVVHTTGAEANFHGILAAWLLSVPVRIAEEIGMPSHSKTANLVFKWIYRLSTSVIAVADVVKAYLIRTKEAVENQVVVIYNPVDTRVYDGTVKSITPGLFRIVSVCRLDPIKNLEILIRGIGAMKHKFSDRNIQLSLVGDGPSRIKLETLVKELNLGREVIFQGFQANPVRFLADASLFVLPSFSEGIPLSVAEAMLTNTPCAVTNVGGASEYIRHGENGWLLDPNDQGAFDNLLEIIVSLPESQRTVIGRNGRTTAIRLFSPEHYIRKVWDLYQR
jgi:glycosyltransferase involved in cell wall biosynthesis